MDLPMVTDAATAKLVGTRLAMLLTLPKTPYVIPCSRAAFAVQFGDVIAINDPTLKYGSQTPLVVLQVQEMGVGDETILLSIVPSLFGSLPISKQVVGGGGSGFSGWVRRTIRSRRRTRGSCRMNSRRMVPTIHCVRRAGRSRCAGILALGQR